MGRLVGVASVEEEVSLNLPLPLSALSMAEALRCGGEIRGCLIFIVLFTLVATAWLLYELLSGRMGRDE